MKYINIFSLLICIGTIGGHIKINTPTIYRGKQLEKFKPESQMLRVTKWYSFYFFFIFLVSSEHSSKINKVNGIILLLRKQWKFIATINRKTRFVPEQEWEKKKPPFYLAFISDDSFHLIKSRFHQIIVLTYHDFKTKQLLVLKFITRYWRVHNKYEAILGWWNQLVSV